MSRSYIGGIIGADPLVSVTGQFMLIGGGGGGSGSANPGLPGGGGGGGVVYGSSFSFSTGSYAIVVGDGGASAAHLYYGNAGYDTTGFGFTAKGGGGGVGGGSGGTPAYNGGSGGGPNGSSTQATYSGTDNVTGYGSSGGSGSSVIPYTGGGGGGAGGAGGTGTGGDGLTNSFLNDIQYGELSGGNYYVAGGGGGGRYNVGTTASAAAGGLGGGGDGAVGGDSTTSPATVGTNGYGGGGGGGNQIGASASYYDGEAGGKGAVLVWLPQSYSLGSDYTGSATTSAKTVGGVAGTLITFTTSGTWSPTLAQTPRTSGVFNLGGLSGDGASTTRPSRRWGGITGRSLVDNNALPKTGVLTLAEHYQTKL